MTEAAPFAGPDGLSRQAKGGVGKASDADDDEFEWGDDEGYS